MTDELKPVRCGCGGEAEVIKHTFHGASPSYGVECTNCHAESWQFYNTEADAVEAWNRAMKGNAEEKLKAFWDGMSAEMKEERTAKAKVNFKDENYFFGWCECGQYQSSQFPYGARLEWE